MLVFLAIKIQWYIVRDKLTDCCATTNQFHTSFYGSAMKWDRYFHILRFLHFTEKQEWAWHDGRNFWPVIEDAKSVWNSKPEIFKILHPFWTSGCRRNNCIVQRKGHFPTIYTQETRTFGIRIYKLCDETGYTYDMTVYLARDRQRTAQHLTATHARVSEVTKKIQGRGHKLYMDNYFSSPDLFVDFATKHICCCGTVRPNRKGTPQDLGPKRMILQWGDLQVRTSGDLTAILWRDRRDVRILTNTHDAPEEGNSCDNNGRP